MHKKRNVAYVKPPEPSFLNKLKKEAGFVPGPDINTKKEEREAESDSEVEKADESPVVVVLEVGDLTAEEAAKITAEKELEEANKRADLSEKVIFSKPTGSKRKEIDLNESKRSVKKQKKNLKRHLLSFNEEEEEDEC